MFEMMIDRVSTLRRGADAGDALGFWNDTCGQSAHSMKIVHEKVSGRQPTSGLVTFRRVVHHEHE